MQTHWKYKPVLSTQTDPGPKLSSAAHKRNDARKLFNFSESSVKTEKIIPGLQAVAKFYGPIITVFVSGPFLKLDSEFDRVLKFWVVRVGIDLAVV